MLLITAHGDLVRTVKEWWWSLLVFLQSLSAPLDFHWPCTDGMLGLHVEIISLNSDEDQAGLFAGIFSTLSLPYTYKHVTPGGRLLRATQMRYIVTYSITAFIEWFSFEFPCESQWLHMLSLKSFGNQDELLHWTEELRRVYDKSLDLSEGYWGAL